MLSDPRRRFVQFGKGYFGLAGKEYPSSLEKLDPAEGKRCIRHIVIEALEKNELPMHLEDLVEVVKPHFPETNSVQIYYNMMCDSRRRFVHLGKGYFGLSNKDYTSSEIKPETDPK